MASITVRHLDERIVEKLTNRANRNGRSLKDEVRMILEEATQKLKSEEAAEALSWEEEWERIDALRNRLAGSGRTFSDSGEMLGRIRESE